jgi:hypothetical protein
MIFQDDHVGGAKVPSTERTKATNACAGIPNGSLFLYAGRAFPEMDAPIIFLFGGSYDSGKAPIEKGTKGGARPFDTGGLFRSNLKSFINTQCRTNNRRDDNCEGPNCPRKRYFNEHNLDELENWRDYFRYFIQEYFKTPQRYWDGYPDRIDQTQYDESDDWRNWTFEIHIENGLPIDRAGSVIADGEIVNYLLNKLAWNRNVARHIKGIKRYHKPRLEAERIARAMSI